MSRGVCQVLTELVQKIPLMFSFNEDNLFDIQPDGYTAIRALNDVEIGEYYVFDKCIRNVELML